MANADYQFRMREWKELSKDDDANAIANYMATHQLAQSPLPLASRKAEEAKLLQEWATELLSLMKDTGWQKTSH
jgi:hypothetical protein